MSILVTGGGGYIGSHMVLRLLEAGERVVVLDNLSTGRRDAVAADAVFVEGDTGDSNLVSTIIEDHDVREIIHFAGSIIVADSTSDPLGYYLNNVVRSRSLIETAVKKGISRFIFSSTAAVYGSPGLAPVTEDAPLAPQSPYGSTKLATEWMLRETAAATPGLNFGILRYFNVAGADPEMRTGQVGKRSTHLIKIAAEAATGIRQGMQIYGDDYATPDGTCIRDYIHVVDLADAHYLTLLHMRNNGTSITANCGYGRGYSVREVIAAVKRVSGVDFPVQVGPRRPGDPDMIVADSGHLRNETGWKPAFDDLETIVRHALDWEVHFRNRAGNRNRT